MEVAGDRYRFLAPELRGFGGSSLDGQYSLAELAGDSECVRTHLAHDQAIHLVGLSMGGYVAFEYWHQHASHLKSLTLVSTKPEADDEGARAGRFAMAEAATGGNAWNAIAPMLPKLIAQLSFGTRAEQQVTDMMRAVRAEAVVAAQHAMAGRRDFTGQLGSIRVPTLVLAGEHDPISPPEAMQRWSERMPSSLFHIIPAAGHLCPIEATADFHATFSEFLDSMGG